jgi:hypothetical protein
MQFLPISDFLAFGRTTAQRVLRAHASKPDVRSEATCAKLEAFVIGHDGEDNRMRLAAIVALALGLLGGEAAAQTSLKAQIVGTWDFVVAEITAADGKKSFPFGETPKGLLIFTPDGRFSQIHVASDVPRIASGNRLTGTAEENAAILHRSLALFGSYTVDEEKKIVTFNIVSSTFPNWQGEAQTRTIDKLTTDEFVNTNPNVAGGRGRASNYYKRVK